MNLLWFGYKHKSGTYQVKPYFERLDIEDARESPFVQWVVGPFHAISREDALTKARELGNK